MHHQQGTGCHASVLRQSQHRPASVTQFITRAASVGSLCALECRQVPAEIPDGGVEAPPVQVAAWCGTGSGHVATRVSLSTQGIEPPTSLGTLLSFEEVLQRRWLQHCI